MRIVEGTTVARSPWGTFPTCLAPVLWHGLPTVSPPSHVAVGGRPSVATVARSGDHWYLHISTRRREEKSQERNVGNFCQAEVRQTLLASEQAWTAKSVAWRRTGFYLDFVPRIFSLAQSFSVSSVFSVVSYS